VDRTDGRTVPDRLRAAVRRLNQCDGEEVAWMLSIWADLASPTQAPSPMSDAEWEEHVRVGEDALRALRGVRLGAEASLLARAMRSAAAMRGRTWKPAISSGRTSA
jgi:hypothetical protein